MKTDISDLRSQLVEEAKSRLPFPAREDEVTTKSLAEDLGISRRKAALILTEMVEDGTVTVRNTGGCGRLVYKMK